MRKMLPRGKSCIVERLENRRLLSASAPLIPVPTTGIILHEQKGVKFAADLGNFTTLAPGSGLIASINWGDGTTSKGVVKNDGPTGIDEINFEVDGTHKYKKDGTFDISVTVVKPGPTPATVEQLIASFSDIAIVGRGNTILTGSIAGTYSLAPTSNVLGGGYVFNGTGTAGDLGSVTAHGLVSFSGPTAGSATKSASGTLTLTTVSTSSATAGSVTLKLSGAPEPVAGPFPTTLSFVITAGTGAFAGATGSGTIAVTLGPGNAFTFDISSILPPILG